MATQLDLADSQFIGWRQCKIDNNNITALVISMGLTKTEWKKWKQKYPTTTLTEVEMKEIDDYFDKEANSISTNLDVIKSVCHHDFENGIHTRDTCKHCGKSIYE